MNGPHTNPRTIPTIAPVEIEESKEIVETYDNHT